MVAAALSGIVLLGVLTTNLQLMGSGVRLTQYAEMESQVRRSLEKFGGDLRNAKDFKWNSASDITLTLQDATQVTYAWTAATQSLFLVPGANSTVTAGRYYLVTGIPPLANGSAGLTFARFDRDGNAATTDLATKRVLLTMTVGRQAGLFAAATENSVSASFTLRNKPTS